MEISEALGRRIPFGALLGIHMKEQGQGRCVLTLELRPDLMNSFGSAHGGVIMTLLDIAMACAACTLVEDNVGAITVEMKTSFIGVCRGAITAEGTCLHLGSSVAFCEGEIRDATGKLVAKASGTFKVRRAQ
jgi:uncharacterized protein (TIGR00369 family)